MLLLLAWSRRACLNAEADLESAGGRHVKRSRRVVLTTMGAAAIGAVSMGFVRRGGCGPGLVSELTRGADGRLIESCRVTYGGFGGAPRRFHGHAHGGG
jgi:hypothetical protein